MWRDSSAPLAKQHHMGSESIFRLVLSMSVPIMFSLLVQAMYNIVDSVCISAYSEHGLAALTIAFPLQVFLTAVGNGVGTGTGILISRALGAGKRDSTVNLAENGLAAALMGWALTALLLLSGLSFYYQCVSRTQQVIAMGVVYGRIVISASLFLMVESVCTRIIQANGNTVWPMLYQALGAVLNIVLDPLLIFGFGPIPAMGVPGAALATVLGQLTAMCCALWMVIGKLNCKRLRVQLPVQRDIWRMGLPTLLTSALVSAYITGLEGVLARFSEYAVTSLGIYYKIQTFLLLPSYGLEQGTLPILGFNLSAKNRARVWQTFKLSLLISELSLLAGTAAVNWFLPSILTLFSAGPELRATATPALRIISMAFPLFCPTILIPTLLQAAGRLKQSSAVVILRQVVLLVPLAIFLSRWGLLYTWLTFPISEAVSALFCAGLLWQYARQERRSALPEAAFQAETSG